MAGEGDNLDMMSTLPDHIICHILSLIPTECSVRTSVLSTRWKHLFTHVPVLHFDSYKARNDIHRFVVFADKVMRGYNVTNMQKMVLSGYQCGDHDSRWISYAIRRNVRELLIGYCYYDLRPRLQLLVDVYTSKTLVRLKLDGSFIFNLSDDSISLPNLKTLHLFEFVITSEEYVRIRSSNFPVLEDLCMNCFNSYKFNIDICVSSLKRLNLTYSYGLNLVLNAPALEFMEIRIGNLVKISGSMLESLLEAHLTTYINVDPICADEIQNLIKMVSNVHNLSLSDELIKVLVRRDFVLPIFQNLTRLELRNKRPIEQRLLPDLLESSPNLKVLIFHFGLFLDRNKLVEVVDVFKEVVRECVCLSQHLKEVKMGCFYGAELEFEMVEYFLKNAKVLNKMVISLDRNLKSPDKITERLVALPKYSRDCKVVVL